MVDLVEIDAVFRAWKYGDTEKLVALLESNGLQSAGARKLVADMVRGKSSRARGEKYTSEAEEKRNDKVRVLVANRRGLLVAAGADVRKAFSQVSELFEQTEVQICAKTVKRIWESRGRSSLLLGDAFGLGKSGITIAP